MQRKKVSNMAKPNYEKKGPNFMYVISFLILFGMIVSAIIVIRNVNEEYKLRQIAGAFQKYKYAYLSFNNVYSGIPGDLENATFYWKEKTEDGNGDRKITHDNKEGILAWQHMQLAKLIDDETTYSGKWQDSSPGTLIAGYNIPKGYFENTGYYLIYDDSSQKNVIIFSGVGQEPGIPNIASLSAAEAYQLDLIIDDGMPDFGNIRAFSSEEDECSLAGEYKASNEFKECIIKFEI